MDSSVISRSVSVVCLGINGPRQAEQILRSLFSRTPDLGLKYVVPGYEEGMGGKWEERGNDPIVFQAPLFIKASR